MIAFAKMMDDYFSRYDKIRLTVMIVDSRHGLTGDDEDMKEYLEGRKIPYVIAANKIDKLSNNQLMNNKNRLFKDMNNVIYVSAQTRKNMDQLKERIMESVR